jgi:hypothetical protein
MELNCGDIHFGIRDGIASRITLKNLAAATSIYLPFYAIENRKKGTCSSFFHESLNDSLG